MISPREGSMVAPVFVVLILTVAAWRLCGPRTGFLADFAKLLVHAEFVEGFGNWVIKRSFLKGKFHGRHVVVLLQRGRGKYPRTLVISMETHADATIESSQFGGYRSDKEGELALFALEGKHGLEVMHEGGCLKARWRGEPWRAFTTFPGSFDPPKWQNVLEAMNTLAGSLERRAA